MHYPLRPGPERCPRSRRRRAGRAPRSHQRHSPSERLDQYECAPRKSPRSIRRQARSTPSWTMASAASLPPDSLLEAINEETEELGTVGTVTEPESTVAVLELQRTKYDRPHCIVGATAEWTAEHDRHYRALVDGLLAAAKKGEITSLFWS